jgi:hypothetical protein
VALEMVASVVRKYGRAGIRKSVEAILRPY